MRHSDGKYCTSRGKEWAILNSVNEFRGGWRGIGIAITVTVVATFLGTTAFHIFIERPTQSEVVPIYVNEPTDADEEHASEIEDPANSEDSLGAATVSRRWEISGPEEALYTDDNMFVTVPLMNDNRGNYYHGGLFFSTSNLSREGGIVFALDNEWEEFNFEIALPERYKDRAGTSYILVFFDDDLKFTSYPITRGFSPQFVSLDVSGVQNMRINFRTTMQDREWPLREQ